MSVNQFQGLHSQSPPHPIRMFSNSYALSPADNFVNVAVREESRARWRSEGCRVWKECAMIILGGRCGRRETKAADRISNVNCVLQRGVCAPPESCGLRLWVLRRLILCLCISLARVKYHRNTARTHILHMHIFLSQSFRSRFSGVRFTGEFHDFHCCCEVGRVRPLQDLLVVVGVGARGSVTAEEWRGVLQLWF
jgi:hypothetical protein